MTKIELNSYPGVHAGVGSQKFLTSRELLLNIGSTTIAIYPMSPKQISNLAEEIATIAKVLDKEEQGEP